MTNFDLYNLVNAIINKDVNGTPLKAPEFTVLLNSNSNRLFIERLGLEQEFSPNIPVARNGAELSEKTKRDLLPFLSNNPSITATNGTVDLSAETIAYILSALPSPQTVDPFDLLTESEYAMAITNPIDAPTADYPIILFRKDTAIVAPTTITSINISYYTYPTDAVMVITTDPTTLLPVYDAGSSTELEWNDLNKIEIAYMVLRDAGINIKRPDVSQYADNLIKTGK